MGRKPIASGSEKPSVGVTREAKAAIAKWLELNNGAEQGQIVSKIMMWFVSQRPVVQHAIISPDDTELKNVYAVVLRDLANQLSTPAAKAEREAQRASIVIEEIPEPPKPPSSSPKAREKAR